MVCLEFCFPEFCVTLWLSKTQSPEAVEVQDLKNLCVAHCCVNTTNTKMMHGQGRGWKREEERWKSEAARNWDN